MFCEFRVINEKVKKSFHFFLIKFVDLPLKILSAKF